MQIRTLLIPNRSFLSGSDMDYFCNYFSGFGTIPNAIVGEMFRPNVRANGSALAITMTWLIGFALTTSFNSMIAALGGDVTFWLFAVSCVIAFVFTWFVIPETKGKTLNEIQQMMSWLKCLYVGFCFISLCWIAFPFGSLSISIESLSIEQKHHQVFPAYVVGTIEVPTSIVIMRNDKICREPKENLIFDSRSHLAVFFSVTQAKMFVVKTRYLKVNKVGILEINRTHPGLRRQS